MNQIFKGQALEYIFRSRHSEKASSSLRKETSNFEHSSFVSPTYSPIVNQCRHGYLPSVPSAKSPSVLSSVVPSPPLTRPTPSQLPNLVINFGLFPSSLELVWATISYPNPPTQKLNPAKLRPPMKTERLLLRNLANQHRNPERRKRKQTNREVRVRTINRDWR